MTMSLRKLGWTTFAAAIATLFSACDSAGGAKVDGGTDAPMDKATDTVGDAATDTASDGGGLLAMQKRGEYLVKAVIACSDCHTPRDAMGAPDMTKFLAGNPDFVVLPNGDKLGSRNLTNDETGLKNRTDDEIKAMFQNGMRPVATGGTEALFPVMPYYVFHNMTDEDANAIVAYLRTVPAVENMIPRRGVSFDIPAPAAPLNLDNVPVAADTYPEKASADRGRYLSLIHI